MSFFCTAPPHRTSRPQTRRAAGLNALQKPVQLDQSYDTVHRLLPYSTTPTRPPRATTYPRRGRREGPAGSVYRLSDMTLLCGGGKPSRRSPKASPSPTRELTNPP